MSNILQIYDPWKHLRADLFGNAEPEVVLEAITVPVTYPAPRDGIGDAVRYDELNINDVITSDYVGVENIDPRHIEMLPALSASTSYGSTEKVQGNYDKAVKLNKSLIKLKHDTPMESVQFNFHISGISKACGAQISRHRVGQGHVSTSRRFQQQKPAFVYPMLSYIKDEDEARRRLKQFNDVNKITYAYYKDLRSNAIDIGWGTERRAGLTQIHKEDARLVVPVSTATERSWWINVRALRDFFELRLAKDAEWEIRRMAQMMFNLVYPLMPSLFEDIKERFEK